MSENKKISRRTVTSANISKPVTVREKNRSVKSDPSSKWVRWFDDSHNTWPNDAALRARRSPTHSDILGDKVSYTHGKGFYFYNNGEKFTLENLPEGPFKKWVQSVNKKRQSLHDIYKLVARDFVTFGNAPIEIINNKNFVSVFHKDAVKFRILRKGENEKSDSRFCVFSSFWPQIGDNDSNSSQYPISAPVEIWNHRIDTNQKEFIIHMKRDEPGFDIYGVPDHAAVYSWADIEYQIATYNRDKLRNGMFPSVYVGLQGEPPEGMTPEAYVELWVAKMTTKSDDGEGNNQKALIEFLDGENKTEIHEFSSDKDGEFSEMAELASEFIIRGHRWFPELSGIQSKAGLSSDSKKLRQQYNIALKTLIIPDYQEPLNKQFNDIIQMAGFDEWSVSIINSSPIGFEDQIDVHEIATKDELRAAMGWAPLEDESKGSEIGRNKTQNNQQ